MTQQLEAMSSRTVLQLRECACCSQSALHVQLCREVSLVDLTSSNLHSASK
jgi:hypothetical protein